MTQTDVTIERNDGSESFNFKSTRVETEVSNGLVTDSVISGASRRVVGGKFVLDIRTFDVDIDIQGMDAVDYPNSGTYSDDDYGYRWELERASLEWGWDATDGFDKLKYDGRTFNVVITNFAVTEDTSDSVARTYTASVELTYLDAFVT